MKHLYNAVRFGVGFHGGDGLVAVRIEFLSDRIDIDDIEFLEYRTQLLVGQLDAALEALGGDVFGGERGFEACLSNSSMLGMTSGVAVVSAVFAGSLGCCGSCIENPP